MSYIRGGTPLKFVEGRSKDYIFVDVKAGYIEDYDRLHNETIVELLFKHWKTKDSLFKEYLLKKLAERLNVKLRKKPLTEEEEFEMFENSLNIKE